MRTPSLLAGCAGLVLAAVASGDDVGKQVALTLTPKGGYDKAGYFMPMGLELVGDKPAEIKTAPGDLKSPRYALLKLGDLIELGSNGEIVPKDPAKPVPADARPYAIILDQTDDLSSRLLVDSNRDGDLTNDPVAEWTPRDEHNRDGSPISAYKTYMGSATLDLGTPDAARLVHIGVFKFDAKDAQRAHLANHLVVYRDYLAAGKLALGEHTYDVMLSDDHLRGDFRGLTPPTPQAPPTPANAAEISAPASSDEDFRSGVMVLIDVNANGRIDYKGEAYDVRQPFNIGGITYEIADMSPDGSGFKLVKSTRTRDEIKPPPDHAEGKKITPFEATLLDGKKIKFPDDYKGKLVLLDFWATWCGPCIMEVPNVVAAYGKYHDKGFEVLGVSLDNKDALDRLKQVTADKKMTWPQIFEGKGWKSSLVDLYAVTGIPACWLVDGDTGLIVAEEHRLRGVQISDTIEAELKKKEGRVP